jgi:hypothetical protein
MQGKGAGDGMEWNGMVEKGPKYHFVKVFCCTLIHCFSTVNMLTTFRAAGLMGMQNDGGGKGGRRLQIERGNNEGSTVISG